MTSTEQAGPAELARDFDPTDPRVVRDPYPVYEAMRRECPVGHGSRFGGFSVLSRFADVCEAAQHPELFSSASGVTVPDFGNPMNAIPLEVDPPEHTQWRHLIQAWSSPQSAAALEPDIRTIVTGVMDAFVDRGRADLATELATPVPPLVIGRMLGLPESDWHCAIEESLRLESPIQYFSRTVTRDTAIGGTTLPAGEKVLLSWASANRDPAAFDDPEAFVHDRPHNRHVAFGAGPHRCLGAHLARLELRVVLEEVLRRIPNYRLEDPGTVVMAGGINRLVRSLPVVW